MDHQCCKWQRLMDYWFLMGWKWQRPIFTNHSSHIWMTHCLTCCQFKVFLGCFFFPQVDSCSHGQKSKRALRWHGGVLRCSSCTNNVYKEETSEWNLRLQCFHKAKQEARAISGKTKSVNTNNSSPLREAATDTEHQKSTTDCQSREAHWRRATTELSSKAKSKSNMS